MSCRSPAFVSLLLALGLALAPTPAQDSVNWWQVSREPRSRAASAYDTVRDEVVMFGGTTGLTSPVNNAHDLGDTWVLQGSTWTSRQPRVSPAFREGHAMAYDVARNQTVLYGGVTAAWSATPIYLSDTWLWNGTGWTQASPANVPPGRDRHGMTYDSARGRVVMFGGYGGSARADLWEWDGTDWTLRHSGGGLAPAAREGHGFAYDPVRARALMFGGTNGVNTYYDDTWDYDPAAAQWVQRQASAPSGLGRRETAAVHSPSHAGVVLFGGYGPSIGVRNDTWLWNDGASTWTNLAPSGPPGSRTGHAMAVRIDASDPEEVLVFGGAGTAAFLGDTWSLGGTTWSMLAPAAILPTARYSSAMATDRVGLVLLHGGFSQTALGAEFPLADTWMFDGVTWAPAPNPGLVPPARGGHEMVFDEGRGRFVMFGGATTSGGGGHLSDVWEYSTTTGWIVAPTGPAARRYHQMSYDAARAVTVVVGGRGFFGLLQDTWEYNGTTWSQRFPATLPPFSTGGGRMTFDRTRNVSVLCVAGFGPLSTVEWDGVNWTFRPSAPGGGGWFGLAYDEHRQRCVLVGTGTQEWDGTNWFVRTPTNSIWTRHGAPAVYDPVRRQTVVFGGAPPRSPQGGPLQETWLYRPLDPATVTPFGTGCGPSGPAVLSDLDLPWVGSNFNLQLTTPLAVQGSATFILGTSNTTWGGAPLPLNLTPYGFPGCFLFVSMDVTATVPLTNGVATLSVSVPPPIGVRLYWQAYATDLTSTWWSNASSVVVGAK